MFNSIVEKAMKNILLILITASLTGCGTYGEPLFLAAMYDRADPCQRQNNGGNYPSFCGASNSRTYIYTTAHQGSAGIQTGYFKK